MNAGPGQSVQGMGPGLLGHRAGATHVVALFAVQIRVEALALLVVADAEADGGGSGGGVLRVTPVLSPQP